MTNQVVNVPISYSDLRLIEAVVFSAKLRADLQAKETARIANDPTHCLSEYCTKTLALDIAEQEKATLAYEVISNTITDAELIIRLDGYPFAEEFQL